MKIAVVDDQEKELKKVMKFVRTYCEERKLAAALYSFSAGEELMKKTDTEVFDLIFLDIYLNEDNGMEIAAALREKGFDGMIVFSTVSTDYAISGYSVSAFDYLLKPFDYERFSETMDRCVRQMSHKQQYISVKEQRTYVKILLDDIIYTDYHNHYIQIHTPKRVIKSYMSFGDFFRMLEPHPQFLNCYRNCVINLDHVSAMKGYDFILKTGEIIPVTRKKKTAIRQAYADYEFLRIKKAR